MLINIDINDLAAEITRKIRDEMARLRVVDFGEVKATTNLSNGGWTAQVLLPGAETLTNPLNCLSNYIPKVGDWVMIVYPPRSEPVLVDCTPMRENQIETPDDKYLLDVSEEIQQALEQVLTNYYTKNESDEKYAAIDHNHDGRYYTKTQSDQRYAAINHNHDNVYAKIAQESWTAPTLAGSWSAIGTGYNPPGYKKNTIMEAKLRGRIGGGTVGSTIWTLPTGYRPAATETHAAAAAGGTAEIEIRTDGKIVLISGDPTWISLDGIYFDALQE